MSDDRLITRLSLDARAQRWRHLEELVGDAELHAIGLRGGLPFLYRGTVGEVRAAMDDPERMPGEARPLEAFEPASDDRSLLLVDLAEAGGPGDVGDILVEASRAGRALVVWAPVSLQVLLEAQLAGASTSTLEQASVEGTLLVPAGAEAAAVEADLSAAKREGERVVVVCANVGERALEAAERVALLEAGSERAHLATALGDLRRANATLGRAQRGKSQAAAAIFVDRTEKRLADELEERVRADKEERERWIAGMQAEIAELKQRIVEMEGRRAWRWVVRLEGWRRRLRGS